MPATFQLFICLSKAEVKDSIYPAFEVILRKTLEQLHRILQQGNNLLYQGMGKLKLGLPGIKISSRVLVFKRQYLYLNVAIQANVYELKRTQN
jgi:hypothetical protein